MVYKSLFILGRQPAIGRAELESLLDKYELYLFKKYNRTNNKQTNCEYVHKNVTDEINEMEFITPSLKT